MKHALAIQDLQFGSTGKGQIAGTLAHHWQPDTVVSAWGPNAGHTFRMAGDKWVHTMLPIAALAPSVDQILLGPGSILDVDTLALEINTAKKLLRGKQLIIHPQAVVLRADHATRERNELLRIGSTMKGTGAALCDKVMRTESATVRGNVNAIVQGLMPVVVAADMTLSLSSKVYDRAVDCSYKMIVEGAQGFSLGYHNDFYPHATSRDVSTAQLLADCRLPFPTSDMRFKTLGVARTFPIRVANRERDGIQYTSGGHYDDQLEMSWEDVGREPELTTVTKLPRRVFTFSFEQVIQAVRIMGASRIALTFCDYLMPKEGYAEEGDGERIAIPYPVDSFIQNIEQVTGRAVQVLSFGPLTSDVYEIEEGSNYIRPCTGRFLRTEEDA